MATGLFKKGQSGNPAGRPKGSRNKLEEDFLRVVYEDWEKHGASVVATVREAEPSTYLRVVAQILPKESKVDIEHSGSVEHIGLSEISRRVEDLLAARAGSNSKALLPH